MEPLSVLANIIAVVGAAKTVALALKRICKLRHAPKQLLELSDEVNGLHIILNSLNESLSSKHGQPRDAVFEHYLRGLLQNASSHVRNVNQYIQSNTFPGTKCMDLESMRCLWKVWVKQNNIGNLSMSIRNIRQEISTAMTVLTA